MGTLQVSERLALIASFLPKGTYFADIGSDHAYLACYVCLHDDQAKAIAGDVNKGPFLTAKKTVEQYELQHVIDARLGDGLSVLNNDPITELVIAGMGGSLITTILESGKEDINTVNRIIVQPNIAEVNVRKWFVNNGFKITDEAILEENGKTYEIIVADRYDSNDKQNKISDKELFFGPQLLKRKSTIFYRKWRSREKKIKNILKQLENGKAIDQKKQSQFHKELTWIKEVLQDETSK